MFEELKHQRQTRIAHGSMQPLVHSGFAEKELAEALKSLIEGNKAIEF